MAGVLPTVQACRALLVQWTKRDRQSRSLPHPRRDFSFYLGADRCDSDHPALAETRCALRVGHGGPHQCATRDGHGHEWNCF